MTHPHEIVTIHIDQAKHESPSQTTGAALYALGEVGAGSDLLRRGHGQDDEGIPNDATTVAVKNGDSFESRTRPNAPSNLTLLGVG